MCLKSGAHKKGLLDINNTTCGHHCEQVLVSQADEPFGAFVTPRTFIQRSHFGQSAVDCLEEADVRTEKRLAQFHTVDDTFDQISNHFGGQRSDGKCFPIFPSTFIREIPAINELVAQINSNFMPNIMKVEDLL